MKRKTTEQFIKDAKNIHGDKYDYLLVEYINAHTKVKIICPLHDIFEQTPDSHLCGKGCKICGIKLNHKNTTKSKDKFISDSIKTHSNKYDYSLVNYINSQTKINIICFKHGIFEQIPNNHTIKKQGCPKCAGYNRTTEQFIKESKEVQGDKYDYSLVNYIDSKTKVKIICKKHGIFNQLPIGHLNGKGCEKCVGKNKTTEQFIKESKEVQGDKYDYSLVNYINNKTKVKIICKDHGVFEQSPPSHIFGKSGCPNCFESKGEKQVEQILTENNINFITQKKFDGCKYKRKLKFDFYLPDYNMCIEYDGEQHDVMYRFEKNNERLKIRQLRDQIKNEYCKNNNIRLLRIKYNEDIENKLINIIF